MLRFECLPNKAVVLKSGKCEVQIFLRVWSFLLTCSVHFARGRFGRLLWDSAEVARNRRRTTCTEHASKKIRPSKTLELYIFQRDSDLIRSRCHMSEMGGGPSTVSQSTVSTTKLIGPRRVPGRELSEFLSIYDFWEVLKGTCPKGALEFY